MRLSKTLYEPIKKLLAKRDKPKNPKKPIEQTREDIQETVKRIKKEHSID